MGHTPGPWKPGGCDNNIIWAKGYRSTPHCSNPHDPDGECAVVTTVEDPFWCGPHLPLDLDTEAWEAEMKANRSLIAAAPDLLAACRAWEAWEADIILNADWGNDTPRLTQEQWDRVIELQVMRNAAIAKAEGR